MQGRLTTFVFCLGQEWHPDFKLIGECDRSMLYSGALSLQHGNVNFQMDIIMFFFIYKYSSGR
jgi:hypothetical protein